MSFGIPLCRIGLSILPILPLLGYTFGWDTAPYRTFAYQVDPEGIRD